MSGPVDISTASEWAFPAASSANRHIFPVAPAGMSQLSEWLSAACASSDVFLLPPAAFTFVQASQAVASSAPPTTRIPTLRRSEPADPLRAAGSANVTLYV